MAFRQLLKTVSTSPHTFRCVNYFTRDVHAQDALTAQVKSNKETLLRNANADFDVYMARAGDVYATVCGIHTVGARYNWYYELQVQCALSLPPFLILSNSILFLYTLFSQIEAIKMWITSLRVFHPHQDQYRKLQMCVKSAAVKLPRGVKRILKY